MLSSMRIGSGALDSFLRDGSLVMVDAQASSLDTLADGMVGSVPDVIAVVALFL
jgi:hypothetical protein